LNEKQPKIAMFSQADQAMLNAKSMQADLLVPEGRKQNRRIDIKIQPVL
jgi:flagellar motor protein MotB